MEINGSWLVPTHEAAGHRPRDRAAAGGPGRPGHLHQPDGCGRVARHQGAGAAWEFVKYLASPAAQTKIMELKASVPVNKEVLAGPYRDLLRRGEVFADAIAYAHLKPSFTGYNEFNTALQDGARRERLQRPQQDRGGRDRRRCTTSWTGSSAGQ